MKATMIQMDEYSVDAQKNKLCKHAENQEKDCEKLLFTEHRFDAKEIDFKNSGFHNTVEVKTWAKICLGKEVDNN